MIKCECSGRGNCPRRNGAYVSRMLWEDCQRGKSEHVDRVLAAQEEGIRYAPAPTPSCRFLTPSETCELADEVAGTPCKVDSRVCAACTSSTRSRRLNRQVLAVALDHNPSIDTEKLLAIVDGESEGFGTRLANTLGWFIPQEPGCKCPGYQDLLDTWTPEYIRANLDRVVGWLQNEAEVRRIPFSRTLTKLLLQALLQFH